MSSVLTFQFVPIDESGEVDQLKWQAISFYESESDAVCYWEIYCNRHGLFTVDCSDYQMVDGCESNSVNLSNFGTAKELCERLEARLQMVLENDGFDVVPVLQKREQRNKGLIPA